MQEIRVKWIFPPFFVFSVENYYLKHVGEWAALPKAWRHLAFILFYVQFLREEMWAFQRL